MVKLRLLPFLALLAMAAPAAAQQTQNDTLQPTYGGPATPLPFIGYGTSVPVTTTYTGALGGPVGTPPTGALYVNQAGASGARIYWFFGGTWVAQAAP